MNLSLPEAAAKPFDAQGLGRMLLRTIRSGALATNDPASGYPLSTLVTIATDVDGSPILLLSGLSLHTRNLLANPRASLLLSATGKGDPLAHPRLTLVGSFEVSEEPRVARRFVARHPKSRLYVELPDFRFFRMNISGVHLNGGFARAASLTPADLLLDLSEAEELLAIEEGAVAHMNQDHIEALALYAGQPAGTGTVCTGLDPEGIDLLSGDEAVRAVFPERITRAVALRKVLKSMADDLRARQA